MNGNLGRIKFAMTNPQSDELPQETPSMEVKEPLPIEQKTQQKKKPKRWQKGKKDKKKDKDADKEPKDDANDKTEKTEKDTIDIIEEDSTTPQKTLIYVHPDELWLKGKNKPFFIQALQKNMQRQYKLAGIPNDHFKVTHENVELYITCFPEDAEKIIECTKKVFGICNFGRCYRVKRDMDTLKQECLTKFQAFISNQSPPITNFKVECSRQDKQFQLTSPEVSRIVGDVISTSLKLPAKMKDPDITIYVEVLHRCFLFYFEKIEGSHGLPVDSSGRVAVLLSGGFDSPVAAWTVMRRGCSVRYIHFHSAPYGEWKSSITKVRKIVQQLATWGGPLKFYSVPIGEQQRLIAKDAPAKLRVTLYRRLMLRVAKQIAETQKCIALATGDSLGQVASQTIESMTTIQSVIAPFLVLRPLIGSNKNSIMKKARKIGTHDLSIIPAGDCCSHMLPKNPATRPSIEDATNGEKNLNIEEMVQNAIASMQLIDVTEPWNDDNDEEGAVCPFDVQE